VSQQNVESVRKGIDAFNRRDFDTALELVSEDVTFERFLSRTESQTEWVRGRRELRAVWASQVEAVDLRVEPEEFIAVGADKVIVPVRMIARGSSSEVRLEASIAWIYTFDESGIATRVEVFESRDEALSAAGLGV
jgi:ketosteroid isomerase-like protein